MKHYYISPLEVKHWIPKAKLHIKHALQELECPEYKNKPETTMVTMVGTDSITPISFSYGLLGIAIELIYKTLAVSTFKPLYMGQRGHKIKDIHKRLNDNSKKMIEEYAVNLISCFNYYPSENHNFYSVINEIDSKIVNANVKYNNVPQKGPFYPKICKNSCFEAFGYNRIQAIIQFMKEISEVAYNMLGLAQHIITNTEKICPELSPENENDRDLIFEKCSKFIEDFEMKILYNEPLITSPGGTEMYIQTPKILITASELTISELYPNSLNMTKSMGLHNSFNKKKMSFVVRGWEDADKILASIIKSQYKSLSSITAIRSKKSEKSEQK